MGDRGEAVDPSESVLISHQPIILLLASTNSSLPPSRVMHVMSHYHPTATSSSNFQLIFNDASEAYEKRTGKSLCAHPLAAQLQVCNSPSSILALLQQQVQVLVQPQSSDGRRTKWMRKKIFAFSRTFGEKIWLVCSRTWDL